jgi:hypothetical protein
MQPCRKDTVRQGVGSGECTALATEALRYAGARLPGQAQASWGNELEDARGRPAGDIIQFEDAVFVRRRVRDDGAMVTLTFMYPHRTAIVERGPKPVPVILHENAGVAGGDQDGQKAVKEWTIDPMPDLPAPRSPKANP